MRTIELAAHAKINLTLDVVGRRPDGFHELRSVFARVSLADEVRVRRARAWRVSIRPPLADRPDLAERAARDLARRVGRADAATIAIRKRIPVASGLGGGSSDAAHALRALATLWRVDDATVLASAAAIGSDVPFFLDGPLALVRGRGEQVQALDGGPWWGALAFLGGRISTAAAFARLEPASWSDGTRTARLVDALRSRAVGAAELRELCGNDLDAVAVSLCPAIARLRAELSPTPLFLTGSGPALFAIAHDRGGALAIRRRIRRAGARAIVIQIAIAPESSS
ncbi:MAG TPA: 4-(cytidine 5'-diphospho)-2-C-methyl-D-erythritol kinase [Candidatus Dormibacteraeota bacterium]|nr:4-(cytidine 5'-diphospho)-2-C-methyl-D-erythritol kinase [Candidatus Dormibacteraeota bacterium]